MSGTREECVFMARLAEQAERFEDMVQYMKRVALMGSELNLEERSLLAVAFKNSAASRRQAWRAVCAVLLDPTVEANLIKGYKTTIEGELHEKCTEVLQILDVVTPNASDAEAKVFFYKMKGDYYRYLAEFASGGAKQEYATGGHDAYKAASDFATRELPAAHPVRLGLALNFSVFFNEVLGDPQQACSLAKTAMDEALPLLDAMSPELQVDSHQILALLTENYSLWVSALMPADGTKPPEQDGTGVEDL